MRTKTKAKAKAMGTTDDVHIAIRRRRKDEKIVSQCRIKKYLRSRCSFDGTPEETYVVGL